MGWVSLNEEIEERRQEAFSIQDDSKRLIRSLAKQWSNLDLVNLNRVKLAATLEKALDEATATLRTIQSRIIDLNRGLAKLEKKSRQLTHIQRRLADTEAALGKCRQRRTVVTMERDALRSENARLRAVIDEPRGKGPASTKFVA
jgi:DNA repair exonuclease SbcCD ATPase subunit